MTVQQIHDYAAKMLALAEAEGGALEAGERIAIIIAVINNCGAPVSDAL